MEQQWSELDDFLEELNTPNDDEELLHEEDLEVKNKKKRPRQYSTAANKRDCLFQGMEQQWSELDDFLEELNTPNDDEELLHEEDLKVKNKKKRPRQYLTAANKRGICYLSRVPPHMDPASLRHILSKYGEIERLYLAPEDPKAQVPRKRTGGFRGKGFSEGWVEFTKKRDAKRIAEMLNGEQIGGRRRSSFYYDIWNIKYLGELKWEDLSSERAYQNQARKQKITMEISAAKRERDFYLTKVDRSRALNFIKERIEKKQKTPGPEPSGGTAPLQEPKVHKTVRQIPQNRSVTDGAAQSKPRLSKDFLAGVFGGSS